MRKVTTAGPGRHFGGDVRRGPVRSMNTDKQLHDDNSEPHLRKGERR